jgi:hypothetical protein
MTVIHRVRLFDNLVKEHLLEGLVDLDFLLCRPLLASVSHCFVSISTSKGDLLQRHCDEKRSSVPSRDDGGVLPVASYREVSAEVLR